jgi:hypothetical protein
MKWCCDGFRNMAENRHGDGFLAYAIAPDSQHAQHDRLQFRIGFRAITWESAEKWQIPETSINYDNLKLTGVFGLVFCPWCGVRLAQHYEHSYSEIVDEELRREFEG